MNRKNNTSLLRNILRTLPVLTGVAAVFYVALLIRDIEIPTVLPVKNIQVNGELNFIDKNKIKMMVEDNISGGYFTVDLNNIRTIISLEPWIKNVSLKRQWPAGVKVFIDERSPVAYWNDDGYISETGDVFKPVYIDKKLNLPKLNGPEGHHNSVWKFMNVLYKEMASLGYDVVRLDLDSRRAWQLVIAGRHVVEGKAVNNNIEEKSDSGNNIIDVRLGRFDTEKRLQRFVRVLPALTTESGQLENNIKAIDMRYPNGFAVQMIEKNNIQSQYFLHKNILQNQNNSHNFVSAHLYAAEQMGEA